LHSLSILTPVGGRMVDGQGRIIEVILRDLLDGCGPRPWYRVTWHHRILLGRGYYRMAELDAVLALVDAESLVEVIELKPLPHQPPERPGRSRPRSRRSSPTLFASRTRSSSSVTPASSSSIAAPAVARACRGSCSSSGGSRAGVVPCPRGTRGREEALGGREERGEGGEEGRSSVHVLDRAGGHWASGWVRRWVPDRTKAAALTGEGRRLHVVGARPTTARPSRGVTG
jgi:hypothetical protein